MVTTKSLSKKFIKYAQRQEQKQQKFLSDKYVLNKKTGEVIELKYSVTKEYSKYYKWIVQNSIDIQQQAEEYGFNACMFITITLNSQYHPYSSGKPNKNYDAKNTIHNGYSLLKDTYRNITKQINRTIGKNTYRHIRVIEPHKDFTPHLHALIFVNKDNYNALAQIVKNKIGYIGNVNIPKNGTYKSVMQGSNGIGFVDVEEIKDVKRGAAYLLKYLRKTFNSEDPNTIYMLDGWKRKNKIKVLTYSQKNSIPRYVFERLVHFIPKHVKENQNALTWARKNINLVYKKDKKTHVNDTVQYKRYIIKGKKRKTVKITNTNAKFTVIVKKTTKAEIKKVEKKESDDKRYVFVDGKICKIYTKTKKTAKVKNIIIYNNINAIIYIKKDYELVETK